MVPWEKEPPPPDWMESSPEHTSTACHWSASGKGDRCAREKQVPVTPWAQVAQGWLSVSYA